MTRRFAEDTQVAVGRSREQIDALLRRWGVHGIQWTDDFRDGRVCLQFAWSHGGNDYLARIAIRLPDESALRQQAVDGRTSRFSQSKFDKLVEARGRQEHRLLLLFLKASLEAIEAGVIRAEQLFLPYLVGSDGRTVGEVAEERLSVLLGGSAVGLLLPHGGGHA